MGAGHCLGTSPSATRFPLPAAGFRRVYAAVVAGLSNAASRVAMVRGFSRLRENDEMGARMTKWDRQAGPRVAGGRP